MGPEVCLFLTQKKKKCLFALAQPTATSKAIQDLFFVVVAFFHYFETFVSKNEYIWVKTFQKVENNKDINGDRRVKQDRVKSDKPFDLKTS